MSKSLILTPYCQLVKNHQYIKNSKVLRFSKSAQSILVYLTGNEM